jgi:hypothetical protein
MMCDNYRAVTLHCTTYNILINNLNVTLVPYADEITGEYMQGSEGEDQLLTKYLL